MKTLRALLIGLVVIAMPFFLITSAVRLLFNPVLLPLEYNMPGFPPDPYGFTTADRIHWSKYAVEYLYNDAGIEYLGDLRFPDGSPLYNERELSHMVDVKVWFQGLLTTWWVLLGLILLAGLVAWQAGWLSAFWMAVSNGGWATIGLIVGILLLVAINFSALFTVFHRIFFKGDTWLFEYSDTLIRLLPMRLWQDLFIAAGAVILLLALLCAFLGKRLARR